MRSLRSLAVFTTCIGLLSASEGAVEAQDIPEWAQDQLDAWYEAHVSRDAEAIADLYSPDARVGDAVGRAAIIERFQNNWATDDLTCTGGFEDFVVVNDLAMGWGLDTCTAKSGGEAVRSKWLAVYERQADGQWLCIRDVSELIE